MLLLSKNAGMNILVKNQALVKLCWCRKLTNTGKLGTYRRCMLPLIVPSSNANHQVLTYHTSSSLLKNRSWNSFEEQRQRAVDHTTQFSAYYINKLLRRQSKRTKMVLTSVAVMIGGLGLYYLYYLLGGLGLYVYFFRDEVTDAMAETVSTVASKSLEDDSLISSAQVHTQLLIHNILNDDKIQQEAVNFIQRVLDSEETRNTVTNVLIDVIKNEDFYRVVADKLKQITLDILKSEDTREVVRDQLHAIFMDPSTTAILERVFKDVISQDQVQEATTQFMKEVIASDLVYDKSSEVATNLALQVLEDDAVQKRAADALWSALKYTVVPFNLWQSTPGGGSNESSEETNKTKEVEEKKEEKNKDSQKNVTITIDADMPGFTVLASDVERMT